MDFGENIIGSDSSQPTSSKERPPLADVTDLVTPSNVSLFPTHSLSYRMEHRKRAHEEEMVHDITPPNCMLLSPDVITNQQTPGIFKFRRRASDQPPIDYFKIYPIPIEVMRHVFRFLNKRDTCNAMQTCRFFYSAGATCDNWEFMDLHNRRIHDTRLSALLERKVKVCRMSDAKIAATEALPMSLPSHTDGHSFFYNLTHLDMGRASFSRTEALTTILSGCKHLEGLCMESIDFCQKGSQIGSYIGQNRNLRFLDLSMTRGLTPFAVESIADGCRRLKELNMAWCDLDPSSVGILVEKLPGSLERLNLSGTRNKTSVVDQDIELLVQTCPSLNEIDLSDSLELSDRAVLALLNLDLRVLSLNRCYNITPHMYLECQHMESLNVFGTMTDQGYLSLQEQLVHTEVNQSVINYIAKPTIPPAVSSIWQQRTRDWY